MSDNYTPKWPEFLNVTTAIVTDRPKRHEIDCQMCEKSFMASRTDAKYCSASCRKFASRRKAQLKRAANHAISHINFIKTQMVKFPDLAIIGSLELERIVAKCATRRDDT